MERKKFLYVDYRNFSLLPHQIAIRLSILSFLQASILPAVKINSIYKYESVPFFLRNVEEIITCWIEGQVFHC